MTIETFSAIPSRSFRKTKKTRVRVSSFGDGYEQRALDGINTIGQEFQLQFTNISISSAQDIDDFLDARGGLEAFYWTPTGDATQMLFKCEEWDVEYSSHISRSVTATFKRVFSAV